MSILGTGQSTKQTALRGMSTAARLETERENANEQLEAQYKQTKANMAGSGMASGAMIGGMIGGPWGALAGGAIGGLAGFFGADLF